MTTSWSYRSRSRSVSPSFRASPIASTISTFLLRHRLLLQSHGFEGLGVVEIVSLPDDLAALDRVDVGDAETGVDAARPTSNVPVHARHDVVAGPDQLSNDRRVFTFPGLLQAFKEPTDRGLTGEGFGLYPCRRRHHLGVSGVQVNE